MHGILRSLLNETSRKRTVSADGVDDEDRDNECRWSWPGWADVAAGQAGAVEGQVTVFVA
jgi:hypothetical protein